MNQKDWEATIAWSKIVAGCVIRREDGKYVLVQEKQAVVYGLWNLPAGHVDKGESIEAAAVREAKEETGFDVELTDKIGIYHETVESPVRHTFAARITGGKIVIDPKEILDVKWFSYQQITKLKNEGKLRADWIYDPITIVETGILNSAK